MRPPDFLLSFGFTSLYLAHAGRSKCGNLWSQARLWLAILLCEVKANKSLNIVILTTYITPSSLVVYFVDKHNVIHL